ncbi:MAG: PQQ-binding-like beta-propeller repeat protein [Pirellulales bacterium]
MTRWILLTLVVAWSDCAGAAEPPAAVQDYSYIWPGFLGAGCGATDERTLPLEWHESQHVAWRVKLPGRGQSEAIVWQDHVYATSVTDEPSLVLTCLARGDGTVRWRKAWSTEARIRLGENFANAASTPACDSQGIYAAFESGDIVALTHDGHERWRRSLTRDYGEWKIESGWASSLAQDESLVFALVDHENGSYLAALRKDTGHTEWRVERAAHKSSWSSPVLANIGGAMQLVVSSCGSVDGYDPTSGRLCWRFGELAGNTAPSARVCGAGVFLVGANIENPRFDASRAWHSNMAIRVTYERGVWQVHEQWRSVTGPTFYATPLAHRGAAYWIDRRGFLSCLSTDEGTVHYTERLGETSWASPIAVGGRVYVFGRKGTTWVLKSGAEFEVLSTNRLPLTPDDAPADVQPAVYSASAVHGALFLRTDSRLTCLSP